VLGECALRVVEQGNNYTRWRGGDATNGTTQLVMADEIVRLTQQACITTERNANHVADKIGTLEQQFRADTDWLDNTGSVVTDEESIKAAVKKRCLYYYSLVEIMADRPSTRPLVLFQGIKDNTALL
jgi:hypothetical protein